MRGSTTWWPIPLVLIAGITTAIAEPRTATVTIANDAGWPTAGKAIAVRIGGGAWRTVKPSKVGGPFPIAIGAKPTAVAIDVRAPTSAKPWRRWAAIVPGATYKLVGNPCAHWGLEVEGGPAPDVDADGNSVEARVRIDTSKLPASRFPLVISTDLGAADPPELGESTVVLDKPGMSAPLPLMVSAMCSRSGASITMWSGGAKKAWFDETLIAHPGRLHTLRVTGTGAFTLAIE